MTGYSPQGFGSSASGGNTGMPSYQPNTPISWDKGGYWAQNGQPLGAQSGSSFGGQPNDAFHTAMDYFSKLRGGSAIPQNAQGMNLTYPGQQPGQGGQGQPQWMGLARALAGSSPGGGSLPPAGGASGPISTPAAFMQNPLANYLFSNYGQGASGAAPTAAGGTLNPYNPGGYGQGINPMFNPGSTTSSPPSQGGAPAAPLPPLPFATANLNGYGQGGELTFGGGPLIGGGL